ncbi:ABC transporter permease [Mesorhizobium sp. NZP2077]|uniref:ABC transporter permease n=1 Tax=Mesorhizobium sp. NZP2077 TaxID=2483404 RepID=UPI001553E4D6|nr:ABC transporter permease [Mesorhizobium sp. NZP2077]QKC86828.1 ABC transporter permease [Mesorhizobium sp. NZP2077]QKD20534.1 ABC transporter permease [Mesorhizobium sp. NZP2077]
MTTTGLHTLRHSAFRIALRHALGQILQAFNVNKTTWIGILIFLALILLAAFASLVAPFNPNAQHIVDRLQGPSVKYLLGTDQLGRDILSRLLYGARISLLIGLLSTMLGAFVGSIFGILAGYYGGRFDIVVMQVMDAMLALPSIILGLLLVAVLGPTMTNLVIAIAVGLVPSYARIARAPTIGIKNRDFVDACRSMGFSNARIMIFHVVPNILPEILVVTSMWLATAIRTEASLAFLGLGVRPPIPTWGGMVREGFESILTNPTLAIVPSIAILLVVFSLNLIGDGLRDAVDPKLRGEVA